MTPESLRLDPSQSRQDSKLFALRLAAVGGGVLICILSLVPGSFRPHIPMFSGQMEHASAYLVVASIAALALPHLRPQRLAMSFAFLSCVLETSQFFSVDRDPSFADATASAVGAIIGVAIVTQIVNRLAATA